MGPDITLVAIFALGGLAIGLLTCFVGLTKGQEFTSWLALYGFIVTATTLLGTQSPFWTVLTSALVANTVAAVVQILLLPKYRASNPWYADELDRPIHHTAGWLTGFALFEGGLFGVIAASLAWSLSLL